MGNSLLYRMPSGVPGDVTRPGEGAVIESGLFDTAKVPAAFGAPIKMVAGKVTKIEANDLASVFYGLLCRIAPSIAGDTLQTLASGTPNPKSVQGILVRGFMNVLCLVGTPVRNAAVYMRVVVNGGKLVGDLEATADVTVAGGVITGTGTGTIAASISNMATAIAGTWSLILQTTSQTAKVTVVDPLGVRHADATVGTAYTTSGLTFTITAAGTMTANDSFSPIVTANNVALPGVVWAVDGLDADKNAEVRVK